MATLPEVLAAALRHHQGGRLEAAAGLYRRILAQAPDHADALHLLGLAARRIGRPGDALRLMRRALRLAPEMAAARHNLANALRDGGQAEAAARCCRQAIALAPDGAQAYQGLGQSLGRSTGRSPDRTAGEEAGLAALRRAVILETDRAEGWNSLANALQEQDRLAEAAAAYRKALAADPQHVAAWNNLGIALRGLRRFEETVACHRRATRLAPAFAAAHTSLGLTLQDLGRTGEATQAHRRAAALDPAFPGALSNLGTVRLAMNDAAGAVRCYRRAVTLDPRAPDPHRNLGMALLVAGELGEGWREYEWRLRCKDIAGAVDIPRPRWQGEPLEGRRILLHSEQGLGDAIQFSRYIPLVAARGGRVLLGVPPLLGPLLGNIPGVAEVVSGQLPLDRFDLHAPLLSLPAIFDTDEATTPCAVPYLHPEPEAVAGWAERLAGHDGMRVGVVWAGSPGHANDRNRSLTLEALAPLSRLPGVTLFSIQKGPTEGLAADPPAGMRLVNLSPHISSFLDTAAIAANLDLVVCVDTSVAHLAGALGRPVWVLVPFAPDWRWMLDREDTPWYPTMRLFRQTRPGDWSEPLARLEGALRALA